jgi:hypothetical protein
MENKQSQVINDIAKFFQAALIDLPSAAASQLLAGDAKKDAKDDAVQAAGWKAYDAFVRIANESANQLYANPLFGEMAARSLEIGLQARRVSNSLMSGLFRDLLPVIGLPSARDISRLNRSVEALRDEVQAVRAAQDNADGLEDSYTAPRAAEVQNPSAQIVWNGLKPDAPRPQGREKKSVTL